MLKQVHGWPDDSAGLGTCLTTAPLCSNDLLFSFCLLLHINSSEMKDNNLVLSSEEEQVSCHTFLRRRKERATDANGDNLTATQSEKLGEMHREL